MKFSHADRLFTKGLPQMNPMTYSCLVSGATEVSEDGLVTHKRTNNSCLLKGLSNVNSSPI